MATKFSRFTPPCVDNATPLDDVEIAPTDATAAAATIDLGAHGPDYQVEHGPPPSPEIAFDTDLEGVDSDVEYLMTKKPGEAGSSGAGHGPPHVQRLLSRLDNMSPAAQNMRAALAATLLSPEEQAQREHAHACRAPGDDVHGLLEREHARADSIRARIAASPRRATATAAAAATTADLPQPWWWPHQS